MWKRLTVVNWNFLEEGSATLVGSFPVGRVSGVRSLEWTPLTSVICWRQTMGSARTSQRAPSQTGRNTNNAFIHSSRTLSRGKGVPRSRGAVAIKTEELECHSEAKNLYLPPLQPSGWSRRWRELPALQRRPLGGEATATGREDGEVPGTISVLHPVPWPQVKPAFKQYEKCQERAEVY